MKTRVLRLATFAACLWMHFGHAEKPNLFWDPKLENVTPPRYEGDAAAIFCRAIKYGLVDAVPPAMGGFVYNAFSPWVKSQSDAFPKTALNHPVLGTDIATYLPTPRSLLELRTFHLGRPEPEESKEVCEFYRGLLAQLFEVQDTFATRAEGALNLEKLENPSDYSKLKTAMDDKVDFWRISSGGAVFPENMLADIRMSADDIAKEYFTIAPRTEILPISKIYRERGFYAPGPGPKTTNLDEEIFTSRFGEYAKRNLYWEREILRPFNYLAGTESKTSSEPWHFLTLDRWPMHSTKGSQYLDVADRAKEVAASFLADYQPELEPGAAPSKSVHRYWFRLFDDTTRNFVKTVNRGTDHRDARFRNFLKILTAELIHAHYIAIPKKIGELRARWNRAIATRKEISRVLAENVSSEFAGIALDRQKELSAAQEKKEVEQEVRNRLEKKMSERGYSPEKRARIRALFQSGREEFIKSLFN